MRPATPTSPRRPGGGTLGAMRDVLPEVERWHAEGRPIALATVIRTWGSAPRRVGAKMALSGDGQIAGSVSGGCVEAAVCEAAATVLQTGRPQLLSFGVADETAWQVGLACGGTIEVFVEPYDAGLHEALGAALKGDAPAAIVTVVRGRDDLVGRKVLVGANVSGSLDDPFRDRAVSAARASLEEGDSRRLEIGDAESPAEIFIDVLPAPPLLVIVGGVHIAVALTALAKILGFRTIVVDPRRTFGSAERFPGVDRLIHSWPDEALGEIALNASTAVAVLTHDPKLDDPALRAALPSRAFYVGALGSDRAQAKRRQRLLEAGVTETQIARLHAPIGLPLGGRSPEEIALAIMAEIVAARNGAATRSDS
jgi:xanthine dehydrogenase accessory factor